MLPHLESSTMMSFWTNIPSGNAGHEQSNAIFDDSWTLLWSLFCLDFPLMLCPFNFMISLLFWATLSPCLTLADSNLSASYIRWPAHHLSDFLISLSPLLFMYRAYWISLGQGGKLICFTVKKRSLRAVDAIVVMNAM